MRSRCHSTPLWLSAKNNKRYSGPLNPMFLNRNNHKSLNALVTKSYPLRGVSHAPAEGRGEEPTYLSCLRAPSPSSPGTEPSIPFSQDPETTPSTPQPRSLRKRPFGDLRSQSQGLHRHAQSQVVKVTRQEASRSLSLAPQGRFHFRSVLTSTDPR